MKSKIAQTLLQQLLRTNSKAEAVIYAERLDELWPDIHVEYDGSSGSRPPDLRVFYLVKAVSRLPHGLAHAAVYIEEVYPDGTARIVKELHNPGHVGALLQRASVRLSVFQNAPPPPPPPTRYQILVLDEEPDQELR